jgi:hypothetical protein
MEVTPDHIKHSGLLKSQSFHFLSTPSNLEAQIERLLNLREEFGLPRPFIVWEPAPPFCNQENLYPCLRASSLVDVFSPNHLELAALFEE